MSLPDSSYYEPLIKIIKETPNHVVRPSRVASQLSMSHADATELLCTFLRNVGSSATFRFESVSTSVIDESPYESPASGATTATKKTMVMTFQFPSDFEKRLHRFQRVSKFRDRLYQLFVILVKLIKIIIALGFILSLLVVTILCTIVLIGAFVALLTQQGRGHDNHSSPLLSPHRVRSIILALRDVLWIYAIFGDSCGCCEWIFGQRQVGDDGRPLYHHQQQQDPFFREIAQDLSLLLSVCCLGPSGGGFGYFWGLHMMQQRQRFMGVDERRRRLWRGWGASRGQETVTSSVNVNTDIPGVYVWNRGGSWRRHSQEDYLDQQGLLNEQNGDENITRVGFVSVAIEFLFGPIPFWPGPSETEKWKLRECFIVHEMSKPNVHGVPFEKFLPYCDHPPSVDQYSDITTSFENQNPNLRFSIISQCLPIITYFAGVPVNGKLDNTITDTNVAANVVFPELMLEAEGDGLSIYASNFAREENELHSHWSHFLYHHDQSPTGPSTLLTTNTVLKNPISMDIPTHMHECYHTLTRLSAFQFYLCFCLGILNLVGILGLQRYIQTTTNSILQSVLIKHFLSIFHIYAWAFLAAPVVRALYIVVLNYRISIRNKRRKQWAEKFQ